VREREGADWVFLLLECSAPDKASVFICLAMGQPPLSCLLQIALFVLMEACCSPHHKVSWPTHYGNLIHIELLHYLCPN